MVGMTIPHMMGIRPLPNMTASQKCSAAVSGTSPREAIHHARWPADNRTAAVISTAPTTASAKPKPIDPVVRVKTMLRIAANTAGTHR